MARVKPDWSIPRPKTGKFADLDHIREHQQIALAASILDAGGLVIGWNLVSTVRNGSGFPTERIFQETVLGYRLRLTMTYTGDFRDRTTFEFDENDGGGFQLFDPSTTDAVYDGTGKLIGESWTT